MVILEGHIRNMSFNDTWTLVLESLPAGSPTDSLQTVSSNILNLTKKTDEISLTVKNNKGQLYNKIGHGHGHEVPGGGLQARYE